MKLSHEALVEKNASLNRSKPSVDWAYERLFDQLIPCLPQNPDHPIVEFGSGHRDLRSRVPGLIRTDIFTRPGIDRVESAYQTSFADHSISAILAIDVFHHLEFPYHALNEWYRILVPDGRVILLEPAISLLGKLVYGPFHAEPIGHPRKIRTGAPPPDFDPFDSRYYAAQGNATFLFVQRKDILWEQDWRALHIERFAALYYILTGGYTRPQLAPLNLLKRIHRMEPLFKKFPQLFATRLMVVLQKTGSTGLQVES